MMVVISTQYMENYGTPTQSYWKYKGGSDYKVLNVPSTLTIEELLEQVRDQIEYKSSYAEEYILDCIERPDDWLSGFEQSQLEYDGAILCPEPTINYEEIVNV
jgi:hypothetical protein